MLWQRTRQENKFQDASSWIPLESKFLVRGFEIAQESRTLENSPNKKCRYVDNHVFFSYVLEDLHWRSLDCSVTLTGEEPDM